MISWVHYGSANLSTFYDASERLRLGARDLVYAARASRQRMAGRAVVPRILCNSFPKSGTHLLAQILLQFPSIINWDDIIAVQSLSGVMNTERHLRWKLASAPQGSLVRTHLMYMPEILKVIESASLRRFFIYRDLRDVAVSHASWVLKEPRYFLHQIYKALPDFDACLLASIKGTPLGSPFGSNLSHPDIGTDFSRWRGWLNDSETVAVKFEDLVGERGGGSEASRLVNIKRIAAALGESLDQADLQKFGSVNMDPAKSHTFLKGNKGAIGGWRDKFKSQHTDAFKLVAGHTLIELGYETGLDW